MKNKPTNKHPIIIPVGFRILIDGKTLMDWYDTYGAKFVEETIGNEIQAFFDSEDWIHQFKSYKEIQNDKKE